MKTAISSTGEALTSKMDPRFGRAPYFVFIEEGADGTMRHYALENPAASAAMGAGTEAARRVAEEKVEAVVSGAVGPNAYEVFEKLGIDVFLGQGDLTVEEAYEKMKKGALQKMSIKRL